MIRRGGMRLLPVVLATGLWLGACSTDECLDNKNSLPKAGFYASDSLASTASPTAVALDSVSVYGIGAPGDSILHDSVSGLSSTYLPFQIDADRTRFVIKYLQKQLSRHGIADTITFNYTMTPYFVSAACGVVYNYDIESVTTTHWCIDSVVCPLGVITNEDIENIKIYFRVASDEKTL